jgi:hypothetical protein
MATSSRPFQSQTVARLVAGGRQIAQGGGRWLRQGRTMAVWAFQVVVYPLYAAAQTLRMAQRQLRATQPWHPVWSRLTGTVPPGPVAADTPIQALLSVLQPLVFQGPVPQPPVGQLVRAHGRWLRQSQAGAVLVPGQWQQLSLGGPLGGVASDLISRRLVLVTVRNDIVANLSPDQQQRLHWAIALMMAEQGRLTQRQAIAQRLQRPGLPLPRSNSALMLPLRWVPPLVRWLQTSPLAAATNLFGEADQQRAAAIAPEPPVSPGDHGVSLPPSGVFAWPWGGATRGLLFPTTEDDRRGDLVIAAPQAVVNPTTPVTALTASQDTQPPVPSGRAPAWSSTSVVSLEPFPQLAQALPPADTLEVQVVQVSYVDDPLVMVLRGLDWVLYAIETRLQSLWAWLQRHW